MRLRVEPVAVRAEACMVDSSFGTRGFCPMVPIPLRCVFCIELMA